MSLQVQIFISLRNLASGSVAVLTEGQLKNLKIRGSEIHDICPCPICFRSKKPLKAANISSDATQIPVIQIDRVITTLELDTTCMFQRSGRDFSILCLLIRCESPTVSTLLA